MCNFFSALILDKNRKALWTPEIDSHSELVNHFNLNDENDRPNFVRVELTPPDGDIWNHDFALWNFKTDQDYKPDWYDENEARETTVAAVKNLIDERFLIGKTVDEIKTGRWWAKDAIIGNFRGGTLKNFSGGTLENFWGGTLENFRGGTLKNFSGGTLKNFSGGTLKNFRGGTLENFWGGTLENFKKDGDGILYKLSENKVIVANPNLKIELWNHEQK